MEKLIQKFLDFGAAFDVPTLGMMRVARAPENRESFWVEVRDPREYHHFAGIIHRGQWVYLCRSRTMVLKRAFFVDDARNFFQVGNVVFALGFGFDYRVLPHHERVHLAKVLLALGIEVDISTDGPLLSGHQKIECLQKAKEKKAFLENQLFHLKVDPASYRTNQFMSSIYDAFSGDAAIG